jgi:putative transposase
MPNYIRLRVDGGTYFFTVVTYQRQPILTNETSRRILREAWKETERRFPFETVAVCLLPDHIHCIWKLPAGDADYSVRWKVLKALFTRAYLNELGAGKRRNIIETKRREAAIWQRRFWEHVIKDEYDLDTHLDYIHYNPVKHGFVDRPIDWSWSSFRRFVNQGVYDEDWEGGAIGRLRGSEWDFDVNI